VSVANSRRLAWAVSGINFFGLAVMADTQHRERDLVLAVRGQPPHRFKGFSSSLVMVSK
jgi:hypothetical protein